MSAVKNDVYSSNNKMDIDYYNYSEERYELMGNSIMKLAPKGAKILNIGSHYLHSSMILAKLDYEVTGVDVSVFWDIDFVQKRKEEYSIGCLKEDNLETFESAKLIENEYDVVIFTEILEHITFNPISFWSRIYSMTKSGGVIYLTTPNSLALPNVLRSLKDLVLMNGIGTKVQDILSKVTYGHHWKEYSKKEIKEYFKAMSDDFEVSTSYFMYQKYDGGGVRPWLWHRLTVIGHLLYFFSPQLESSIIVNKRAGFKIVAPDFY